MFWRTLCGLCCIVLFMSGCYSPLLRVQSIALESESQGAQTALNNESQAQQRAKQPLIFYKECSRNGSAWLHECQSIGLQSMQQAIYLYHPNVMLNNIVMTFYPKKTFIRFEVYDSSLFYDVEE